MHNRGILLSVIIIAAVAVGSLLYLYGGPSFHPSLSRSESSTEKKNSHFNVIGQGDSAIGIDQRVNYRITNAEEFTVLWSMVYGADGRPVPNVDWNKHEILAIFDGSHSTGGYGIRVDDVQDVGSKRALDIAHVQPGETCTPSEDPTSPFVIIEVEKSPLPLTHEDTTHVVTCE